MYLFSCRHLVILIIALMTIFVSACEQNIDKLQSKDDIKGLIKALKTMMGMIERLPCKH